MPYLASIYTYQDVCLIACVNPPQAAALIWQMFTEFVHEKPPLRFQKSIDRILFYDSEDKRQPLFQD